MDIQELKEQALREILKKPELYKEWQDCVNESQQNDILVAAMVDIAYCRGWKNAKACTKASLPRD